MKTRERGMPDEPVWENCFKPMEVLQAHQPGQPTRRDWLDILLVNP
jgi:hypothetical protein